MQTDVQIGKGTSIQPWRGISVYIEGTGEVCYASVHDLVPNGRGGVEFGPAEPVTASFLRTLATGLGTAIPTEFLPESVLYRTSELLVWWVPPQQRTLFFAEHLAELRAASGKLAPQPPLVFAATHDRLWVRALKRNQRPTPDTRLCVAPYMNTYTNGGVCLGSMPVPRAANVSTMDRWVDAFFNSSFTHLGGASRLSTHPRGTAALWAELAGSRRQFPAKYLADARETLHSFVRACQPTS